jgi:hypothetical protein
MIRRLCRCGRRGQGQGALVAAGGKHESAGGEQQDGAD